MDYSQRDALLHRKPLPLETGYERLPSGVLHVAARTDMRGCSGHMLEWWFASRIGDREYRWWHPLDHVSSRWRGGAAGVIPGSTHLVQERFTEGPAVELSIQFREPAEFFGAAALEAARSRGDASVVLCVRGGAGFEPHCTPDGAVIGTRLIHIGRDTEWGLALRSHFFLGHDLAEAGMPPAAIAEIFPDDHAPNLLQHCYDEFTFLSRLLPSVWMAEGCAPESVTRPW